MANILCFTMRLAVGDKMWSFRAAEYKRLQIIMICFFQFIFAIITMCSEAYSVHELFIHAITLYLCLQVS